MNEILMAKQKLPCHMHLLIEQLSSASEKCNVVEHHDTPKVPRSFAIGTTQKQIYMCVLVPGKWEQKTSVCM